MTDKLETFSYGKYPVDSNKKMSVQCDCQMVDKCNKKYTGEYRYILKNIQKNNGKYLCLHCFSIYNTQRNNSNLQTNIDDSMMKNINTEFKAYLLGLIASNGSINNEEIVICLDEKHWELLTKIRNKILPNINLTKLQNMISLKISSSQIKNYSKTFCLCFCCSGTNNHSRNNFRVTR